MVIDMETSLRITPSPKAFAGIKETEIKNIFGSGKRKRFLEANYDFDDENLSFEIIDDFKGSKGWFRVVWPIGADEMDKESARIEVGKKFRVSPDKLVFYLKDVGENRAKEFESLVELLIKTKTLKPSERDYLFELARAFWSRKNRKDFDFRGVLHIGGASGRKIGGQIWFDTKVFFVHNGVIERKKNPV